jgi:hypothetical protein
MMRAGSILFDIRPASSGDRIPEVLFTHLKDLMSTMQEIPVSAIADQRRPGLNERKLRATLRQRHDQSVSRNPGVRSNHANNFDHE